MGTGDGERGREVLEDPAALAAAAADPAAFGAVYRDAAPLLLDFFRWRVVDPEIAGDLTAETFAQLLASLDAYRPELGTPRQFLYGIATKQLHRWRRRAAVSRKYRDRMGMRTEFVWDDELDRVEERLDAERARQRLREALRELGDGQRQAIELRVIEELDYAEIARRLGCTEGAARVRVHRAIGTLVGMMDDQGEPT